MKSFRQSTERALECMKSTCVAATGILMASACASATSLESAEDHSWISLTGNVGIVGPHAFNLDFDGGTATIEMDDWDRFDEASFLTTGQRVTVTGRVDDSLFEERTVEAGTVYVHDGNQYFYASSSDEEGDAPGSERYLVAASVPYYHSVYVPLPEDGDWVSLSGLVTAVDGDEFTMVSGLHTLTVDTDEMAYDPLDDKGANKIEEGDHVHVLGTLDFDFFEVAEVKATSITTIFDSSIGTDS